MVSDIAQARDAATGPGNVYAASPSAPGAFQSTLPSSPYTTRSKKVRHADGRRHGRRAHGEWDQLCPLYSQLEAITIADCQCPGGWVNRTRYDAREYAYGRDDERDAKDTDHFQVANGKTFAFSNEWGATITDVAANSAAEPATHTAARANCSAAVTYGNGDWFYQPGNEQRENLYEPSQWQW